MKKVVKVVAFELMLVLLVVLVTSAVWGVKWNKDMTDAVSCALTWKDKLAETEKDYEVEVTELEKELEWYENTVEMMNEMNEKDIEIAVMEQQMEDTEKYHKLENNMRELVNKETLTIYLEACGLIPAEEE